MVGSLAPDGVLLAAGDCDLHLPGGTLGRVLDDDLHGQLLAHVGSLGAEHADL